MKYYAFISTNDCYRVEFEAPDGMSNEDIEQYIHYNWGQWEKEPLCGSGEDEIVEFGPITPEVTP
jgi:hypothetical protein